jgi:kynurenine 3-monooxygenase
MLQKHQSSLGRRGAILTTRSRNTSMRRNVASTSTIAAEPSSSSKPLPYEGKKACVVGAGPAGATAAMYLARRGFKVDVFEKRSEPVEDKVDTGRAYIIILIPRGKAALEELGVALPTDPHFLTAGSVRHSAKGKVSVVKEPGNITWSRSGLAQYLINAARMAYPASINFDFNADLDTVDLVGKTARFKSAASPSGYKEEHYDLLVGADGAGSSVRGVLATALPGFTTEVQDSGREYKIYTNLTGNIEPPEFKEESGSTLHLWSAKNDPFMSFTSHRNPDDTYSGTFSMKTGDWALPQSVEDVETILKTKFEGIPSKWITPIAQQTFASPASPAGKRIRCSTLGDNASSVLILGDAGHAVTPVFGQGANSSLESCYVLGKALDAARGDVKAVPEIFDQMRRPDAHALFEIDRKAFSFFRRKGPFDPDFLQLLSHVILGTILSKIVPFLYGKQPKLLQLGSAPYSEILSAVKRDSRGALFLLASFLIAGVGKLLGLF